MAVNDVKVTAVDGVGKLEYDNILQKKLDKLRDNNYYENVFSWDMKKTLKNSGKMTLEFKTIDKFRNSLEKQLGMLTYENGLDLFSLDKFYLKLIICYELYTNGQYNESLTEVEDFVQYIETISFDKSNGQYIEAYNHMVLSTYAFIMTSINVNNCEEDYETAKDYFIRGMKTDVFCVLNMLKIECILKPINEIPSIQTLIDAYEVFLNSKGRVKFLAQILLYYTYYDGEKEKIIHYFKLFMDQPFDNAFKYRHLYSVIPVFKIEHFNHDQFLKDLSNKIEYTIKHFICSSEQEKCINDSLLMFSKMVKEASININFKKHGLNGILIEHQTVI